MKKPTREAVLVRIAVPRAPETKRRRRRKAETLDWLDVSRVVEGLAKGRQPLIAATREVTSQYNLGPRGTDILGLIWAGIVHPKELALALDTSRSNISGELARLSAAGLIVMTTADEDKRRIELSLTAAGNAARERVWKGLQDIIERNLADYSLEEIRLLGRMLHDVRGPAEEPDSDGRR
jgi:DNA-binding MarR family transcriptional regulator